MQDAPVATAPAPDGARTRRRGGRRRQVLSFLGVLVTLVVLWELDKVELKEGGN